MGKCKCTLRGKILGDGCEICNPQYIIDILNDELEELREVEEKYFELLYAVESKFENESRHKTALRYITQHEKCTNNPVGYEG